MSFTPVSTPDAPGAIGTYSQATRAGNTVYLSGQIPLDPATMQLVDGDIEAQVRRVFDNLVAVARAAGGDLAHAVKVNVYLANILDFAAMNQIYRQFVVEPYPARTTVQAGLSGHMLIEVDCIAVVPD